jgi:hypothetical protein
MWWASQRVRLAVLLVCLGAAIVVLLGMRTSLQGAVGIGGGGSVEGASTWCAPRGLPAPASADLSELLELRAGLLKVFTFSGGRGYSGGVVTPEDMWSDDSPLGSRSSRSADGLWPAGYEVRWWTRDYDLVADVLVLRTARQAGKLFAEAASADCHRAGAQRPARLPPQGRNLAWVNPDQARQNDVFLLRGRRLYRIAAVRLDSAPAETARAERRAGAELADTLACILPGAGCMASEAVSVDYSPR